MKKNRSFSLSGHMPFFVGSCVLMATGCSHTPQDEVVKTAYYHSYGPQMVETDWENQGSTGEVVEVLKNGVEVRKEYVGGVLDGSSSWTFPHSKITERVEEYKKGQRASYSTNYETGSPKIQEEWLPNDRRIVRSWYEDGAPRCIEEYTGEKLIDGQYLTMDGDVESVVLGGLGARATRSRNGALLSREQLSGSQVIATEAFYPNGQLREAMAFKGGVRHGQCRRYAESGEPLSIEQWTSGIVDGAQLFFEDGRPVRQIPYAMGKKEGVELHFRPGTEEVVEEISWHQNLRHGPSKTYVGGKAHSEWYWRGGKTSEQQYLARAGSSAEPHS
jgi:antitoxin component YwqK of YwqJK toxin-antitoxin module